MERQSLIKDRDHRLRLMEIEREFLDNEAGKLLEEEEKYLDDFLKEYLDKDEELREMVVKQNRLSFIARLFTTKEDWKKRLMELKDFKVIKY